MLQKSIGFSYFTVLFLALVATGCQKADVNALAKRISTRTELIGGPSALGEVGDFLLENAHIRVVVQDKGFSRGFGVHGGSLIDVDRVRAARTGTSAGGRGRDQFGEMFPIAFLQALEPDSVEVVNDGTNGEEATVKVSGVGGDFFSLTKALNQAILNSHELPEYVLDALSVDKLNGDPTIRYDVIYGLKPTDRYVRITVRMTNISENTLQVPSPAGELALSALGVAPDNFQAPLGMVMLFGAGNKVFSPGVGYGVRFALDDAYAAGTDLAFPALPGLLTPGLVSTSRNGISYGLFAKPDPSIPNFIKNRFDENGVNVYERAYGVEIKDDTMLVPFLASAFTGLFYAQTPNEFEPQQSIEFTTYFVVGDGDAASVMDVAYDLREEQTGLLTGAVRDGVTAELMADVSVIVYDENDRPINQFFTNENGRIRGELPSGQYTARVQKEPLLSQPVGFKIAAGQEEHILLAAPTPGRIAVTVRDNTGRLLPAKVTVVGVSDADQAMLEPRQYLFDLQAGEHWRTTDLVPDSADDPMTRQYIENFAYTRDGRATLSLAPGKTWTLYVSRGIEYSVDRIEVQVEAGQTKQIASTLIREVETPGYVSADFHLHAKPSLDSDLPLDERVLSIVGEGVEVLVSTDHNYITDYAPTISDLELNQWATSMIGLELTTLESGHFNGYPLKRELGAMTKGAFEWSMRPPDDLFASVRALGSLGPENTIVQVNHPRDSILGYFDQYDLDPLTAALPEPPDCAVPLSNAAGCIIPPNGPAFRTAEGLSTFSYDFDAIEVMNASVVGLIHHARMPATLEGLNVPDELRNNPPEPGAILCDGDNLAHAGVADDWFNLLNLGHRHIGTGTSDSHDADDHPGAGRTFVFVGHDDPGRVTPKDVVAGLKSRRAIMTTGPFVDFTINDAHIGESISAPSGDVTIKINVQAASWVDVDEGIIWMNGQVLERFPIRLNQGRFRFVDTLTLPKDAWIVVEVRGDTSMFPIHRPVDVPPVMIADALASFASVLGFGASALGDLQPKRIGQLKPVALTNPVWVDIDGDVDGDGKVFEAPGALVGRCEGFQVVYEKFRSTNVQQIPSLMTPKPKITGSFGMPRFKGDILDVRTIFEQFGRHSH